MPPFGFSVKVSLGLGGAFIPSLDLDFTTGVLDSRITFARTSSATYVNSSGLVATAASGSARFGYDPTTLLPRGLLIEEQRTNLLLRSEEFDNASWSKGVFSTVTANATVSPDGTADADKVIINNGINLGTGTGAGVRQDISKAASAITYTLSVYAKAAELNSIILFLANGVASASARATFNLAAGTVGSATTVGAFSGASTMISPAGDGWYRCVLTATSDADTSMRDTFMPFDTVKTQGNGSDGVHLWGAQLEAGAFQTSYIPTTSSQVTRIKDTAVISAPNFAPWYNTVEGTFIAELIMPYGITASKAVFAADDGTATNRIYMYGNSATSGITFIVSDSGAVQANLNSATVPASGSSVKSGISYKADSFSVCANGGSVTTDTSGTVPTAIDRLEIGCHTLSNQLNSHIKRIRYYPSKFSDTNLQAFTV